MNNFIRFLERFHFLILFLVLFTISLWMYLGTTYYQKAKVGRVANEFTGSIAGQFSDIGQYMNLKRSNVELAMENVVLRNEIERLKTVIEESKISSFVDSVQGQKFEYTHARIVNNVVNRQQNFITLNVGSSNGISTGMGVVCSNGVVGVIASTSKNFSTAISLLNINLKVSARHKKSGIFGSLSWDGSNYREVVLRDIPLHVNVAVGDTIVTSGFSAIFPRDIPIGTVSDFYMKDGSFYTIRVKLLTDFRSLDHVYVVKSYEKSEISQIEISNSND